MALSTLRTNLSGLFKTKDGGVEMPQLYLKLTTKCLKQVDSLLSLRVSTQPKFYQEQCRYLVEKLKMAVRSAESFLELISPWYSTFASDEDMAESLEIFKLLLSLGKGVESFIQSCCKETWIQSAIELTNVSDHISSLGFNLELCKIVFSTRAKFATLPTLTVAQVASISEGECKIVKEKADLDKVRLNTDVNALLQSRKSSSKEWQLAMFLVERLKNPSEPAGPTFRVSNQSTHPGNLFKNLEELQLLGEGAFGTVHKARWLGAEVAKKAFRGHGMSDFLQEVSILDGLHHSNIVSLLGYMKTNVHKCYMILELMDGDLHSLMEKRMEKGGISGSPFTISGALDIMLQVAEGMLFLHEKKIVHRDLKSRNILVKCVKAIEVNVLYLHAKVGDFGLSKTKEKSMTYSVQTQNRGTNRWMAPEMIGIGSDDGEMSQGEGQVKYPFKSDIYSFAMVCCEIVTGNVPFPTLSPTEVKKMVLAGDRPQLSAECPFELRTLIEACWRPEPSTRPGFGEICAELRHLKYSQLMRSAWARVPLCFSLNEIMRMTNNFSRENLLSSSSSTSKSSAYRGVMDNTGEVFAVLRVLDAGNTSSDFDHVKTDMEVLPRLHHHNLVTFSGFCCEKSERIFVFEDMAYFRMLHEYHETDSIDPIPVLVWEANIETYLAHYLDLNMKDLLGFPLQVAKLVRKGAQEARSFRQECWDLNNRMEKLIQLLRELVARALKLTAHAVGLYERPTRRIMLELVKALDIALKRVRKCRRSGIQLKRIITITTTIIFRKVNLWLENSIGDVTWLLNVSFSGNKCSGFAGLPPIASTDPVLGHVWEQVSIVHVGTPEEKADGAEYLANLARGNERNVKIIIEEGGAPPLLRLLKEGTIPVQEAAVNAIEHLARDMKQVRQLRHAGASSIFTSHILGSHFTSMKVKLQVARVVAKFAALDKEAQSELGSQGAIKLLVALLADQSNTVESMKDPDQASNLAQLRTSSSTGVRGNSHIHEHLNPSSSGVGVLQRVTVDSEGPEVKLGLKMEAAHALWKLAAGSVRNCRLITDSSALLCFAKLMKHSGGKLKYYSVMAVMEIATAAEYDPKFRQAAFTTDSPSAKAIVEQLLEEITRENGDSPELQVSCCKAIGSLARIFPAPAEAPIGALTSALANQNHDVIQVATGAASALSKFASDENYLHRVEHSKIIIAEGAVEHLVLLAYFHHSESQLSALELLAYLSLNVSESEALARANVIHVLKSTVHDNQLFRMFAEHETTRALINNAIIRLEFCGYRSSSSQGSCVTKTHQCQHLTVPIDDNEELQWILGIAFLRVDPSAEKRPNISLVGPWIRECVV